VLNSGRTIIMSQICIVTTLLLFVLVGSAISAQAKTCTQVHNSCVSKCMRLGIGEARKRGVVQPMPADVCQAHCIGWTTDCKRTGCFNGDLHQECGLIKQ
jgi:hypothetical protein